MTQRTAVVVIGGSQAGLAAGHHLRRLGIEYVLVAQPAPGGALQHMQDSLRLLPGTSGGGSAARRPDGGLHLEHAGVGSRGCG